MKLIDTINMCSHLQRKLFDAGGEYRALRSASVIRSFLTTLTQTGLPFDVDDPLMKRLPGVLLPQ